MKTNTKVLTEARNVVEFQPQGEPRARDRELHPWGGDCLSPKYLRCMGKTRVWVGGAEVNGDAGKVAFCFESETSFS